MAMSEHVADLWAAVLIDIAQKDIDAAEAAKAAKKEKHAKITPADKRQPPASAKSSSPTTGKRRSAWPPKVPRSP